MWICMNDGFVSAVEDRYDNTKLWVRARNKDHLRTLFPNKTISTSNETDYRHRVQCTKDELADIISNRIKNIDYGNFKDSVKDKKLKTLFGRFWGLHWEYQESNPQQ